MSSNLDAFVAYWTGRKDCDFDGVYGAQCVDLVKFYCRDILHIPAIVANAIDEFGKEPDKLIWIANDPHNVNQIPVQGDIIIWNENHQVGTGQFGHTAIVLHADVHGFTSFDQNWPLGAKPRPVVHVYTGIKGWGRLRIVAPKPAPAPIPAPVPIPPSTPIERPKMYALNFHTNPPDVLHPVPQVTTMDSAMKQAYAYCQEHPGATCDIVLTIGPVDPLPPRVDTDHNKSELQ